MTPERLHKMRSVLQKRQNDLTVLLENVFDPHNISAVMRSCDAVGVQEIFVVDTIAPPAKRWGYRSSGSAYKWVTVHQFTNLDHCIAAIRQQYNTILTTHLATDAVSLYKLDLTRKIALAFGNEQNGVSNELNAAADGNFAIPQMGMIPSLNISVACAVTLYEAFRQKQLAGHYQAQKLGREEFETLKAQWVQNEKNV
jgi:tRNA (guanosine-2'-O-)-methyltransferase